jgi:hypothetical protein
MWLEKLSVVAVWLLAAVVLWSPWTGTQTWGNCRGPGPVVHSVGYGFLDYYTVTTVGGRQTTTLDRGGMIGTLAAGVLWSLVCLRCWRRASRVTGATDEFRRTDTPVRPRGR